MRKQIPNILTLLNLFSGCIAISMAFQGNFQAVAFWVAIAALFDLFDGMAARLLKVASPLGKELDSLADIVSFGVAPAAAVFVLMRNFSPLPVPVESLQWLIAYMAFLIPLFSAYRLAKFNIDERQSLSFRGLPTPANGLFWIGYCYGMAEIAQENGCFFYLTAGVIILMSWLMISEIPMFSFKIKNKSLKGNEKQLILIILTVVFLALFGISGIAWGIVSYILLSLFSFVFGKRKSFVPPPLR